MEKYANLNKVERIMQQINDKIVNADTILQKFKDMWKDWQDEKDKIHNEVMME